MARRIACMPAIALLAVLAIGAGIGSARATAGPSAKDVSPFDARAARTGVAHLRTLHTFSGSVLVVRDGRELFRATFGQADRARHSPTRLDTRYRVSDLTHVFTWIGLLQLRDQGKLSLDKSVCVAFRPCPRAWRALTPHDLMAGRSGLHPVNRSELPAWPPTLSQYVDALARKPLFFRPGTRFAPNTSPYFGADSPAILAGRLLEVLSHQSWSDYVRQHILDPARMSDTSLTQKSEDAVGYGKAKTGGVVSRPLPSPRAKPDVLLGMWSTVADFARLNTALDSSRLLSSGSLAILDAQATAKDRARGRGPGCCWIVGSFLGHAADIDGGHGAGDGFYAIIERFPKDHVVTLVFTNFGGSGTFPVADLLSSLALDAYPRPVDVPVSRLRELTGSFGKGGIVLQVVKGELTVTDGFPFVVGPLVPVSPTSFVPRYAPTWELDFATTSTGRAESVTLRERSVVGAHMPLPRDQG